MSYSCPENAGLFLSLFKYAKLMSRKGCGRTALEYCKFLLQLDPSDPLHVLVVIDYYALQSKQYEFLLRLYSEYEDKCSALPNFAFSRALAMRKLEMEESKSKHMITFSSTRLLEDAILLYPMALGPLLEKATGVCPTDVEQPFFQAEAPQLTSTLLNVFVNRNYALWKTSEVDSYAVNTFLMV